MTKAKTQPALDMPVTARNAAKTDAQRAIQAITRLRAQYGSFAAISQELKTAGHETNRGLLCAVMNGKRPPSRELLITLGIRKPRKVLSEAEREARKETREITKALWLIYSYVETGRGVQLTRREDGVFFVRVSQPGKPDMWGGAGDTTFAGAAHWGAKIADGDYWPDDQNLKPDNLDYVFRHFHKPDKWPMP